MGEVVEIKAEENKSRAGGVYDTIVDRRGKEEESGQDGEEVQDPFT